MDDRLIKFDAKGLYIPKADIYIDPWRKVDKAIITHAHSDHARPGMKQYACHHDSVGIMKHRLGKSIKAEGKEYGESFRINGIEFSLHPAGHILGSSQVRVSDGKQTWLVTGDYKTHSCSFARDFEIVKCDTLITESTFGLPVFKWPDPHIVIQEIMDWWNTNAGNGVCSVLYAYSLGKAQRLLLDLDLNFGPVYIHGAVWNTNQVVKDQFPQLATIPKVTDDLSKKDFKNALIVAPPGADSSNWTKRFGTMSTASASGWMKLRGTRRRGSLDRGFVLSDHADWNGLLNTVKGSGAETVYVTHGYSDIFSRYLQELGYNSSVVKTEYEGDLQIEILN